MSDALDFLDRPIKVGDFIVWSSGELAIGLVVSVEEYGYSKHTVLKIVKAVRRPKRKECPRSREPHISEIELIPRAATVYHPDTCVVIPEGAVNEDLRREMLDFARSRAKMAA